MNHSAANGPFVSTTEKALFHRDMTSFGASGGHLHLWKGEKAAGTFNPLKGGGVNAARFKLWVMQIERGFEFLRFCIRGPIVPLLPAREPLTSTRLTKRFFSSESWFPYKCFLSTIDFQKLDHLTPV
jgi:hypothetical protein